MAGCTGSAQWLGGCSPTTTPSSHQLTHKSADQGVNLLLVQLLPFGPIPRSPDMNCNMQNVLHGGTSIPIKSCQAHLHLPPVQTIPYQPPPLGPLLDNNPVIQKALHIKDMLCLKPQLARPSAITSPFAHLLLDMLHMCVCLVASLSPSISEKLPEVLCAAAAAAACCWRLLPAAAHRPLHLHPSGCPCLRSAYET